MASLSLTQRWLKDAVQPYPHGPRVYADVDAVLARHSTLRPKTDVYTFDDGRTQLLLCIHGLLPISFRGASYNIPIALWITREYPRQPPIAYVVPTADMLVKAGRHVDVSGRCSVEYSEQWARKDEGCNLSALVAALQDQFAREPPVYAKQARPPPPVTSARSPPPAPSPSGPPALPSKPASLFHPASPPPLPPHPPRLHPPHFSPVASPPIPVSPPPPPPPPLHHQFTQPPLPYAPAPTYAPPPPPPPAPYHPQPPRLDPPRLPIPDLLDEDDPPATNSAAGGALVLPNAPPRPPNPELLRLQGEVHRKLIAELNSLSQALALDADKLRAQQADLLAGEPAIKDEMARLEAVRDVCRSVADRTRGAVQQAEVNIAELRRKGDPEVDELVCATSIVHNQLINLIADDNAIEDTVYHLHTALNAGRIDLDKFLRATRSLAEEQFMKRALIEKIQNSVSLASAAPDWAAY